MDNNQINAMTQSMVSTFIILFNATHDDKLDKKSPEDRRTVEKAIKDALESIAIDTDSWSYVKGRFLYDIYLNWRESEGTLTEFDLIRPGLTIGLFSDVESYQEHCIRVGESRGKLSSDLIAGTATKVCSECGQEKPVSKFRRNGGAKCNACQCAAFRKRRTTKSTEKPEASDENQA
jgi:hypothetical protein